MRLTAVSGFLISMGLAAWGTAAGQAAPAADGADSPVADGALALKLAPDSESAAGVTAPVKRAADSEPAVPKFSDAQLARVRGWMLELAPSCPPAALASAAQHFLEELQWQQPDSLERLLTDRISASDFESMLLRHLAVPLTAAPQAALREELARQRVQVVLAHTGGMAVSTPQAAAGLIEKLKGTSQASYRRLLEGRIEDEDLVPLLTDARQAGTVSAQLAPAKPKELTAADIMAEFSRRNQKDLALDHMRAYTIEGTLTDADGKQQRLLLFKLRPDRFRLHVLVGDRTRYILSADGTQFWQEVPGGRPQVVSRESLGGRIYLSEFVNPLFGEMEGYAFKRVEDGTLDGRKIYRISVLRADGSHYMAGIDAENFQEVSEEYTGDIRVRYSDFREVAGLTVAFREETSDAKGHKDVFVLARFTANPGLVQEFFETKPHDLNFFAFEHLAAGASVATSAPALSAASATTPLSASAPAPASIKP